MESQQYEHRRGDKGAYQRYLDGMDASMRQKVALVAAHLRAEGRVADMGMGSGTGTEALAALYPALQVIGVDLDPMMVELASERYDLANLSFRQGDISESVFAEQSLDAIVDSSVLHHVTSFGDYQVQRASDAIATQVAQLREHGVIIIRDFLAPSSHDVLLDLPTDDAGQEGGAGGPFALLSSARLLERFATDFRLLAEQPGFCYQRVEAGPGDPDLPVTWSRYQLSLRAATEFILRKDYREDYLSEAKEEYCYFEQAEFEEVFGSLGLRVLASTPLWNPWIINNRYRGKLALWSLAGTPLEFPATNYVIVGEKVADGQGVRFAEGAAREPLGFLQLETHRHKESGRVFDLVRRPHQTIDILPWFELEGDAFVLARASYPRPILRARCREQASLDGASAAGYITEPLLVIQGDKPLGTTVQECLLADAGIEAHQVGSFWRGTTYYPSPGGIEESVTSALVEIAPTLISRPLENRSGFASAGRVMAIEAQQLLRSAAVGGLLDARLELNVYELLLQKKHALGPWIGEQIVLAGSAAPRVTSDLAGLLERPKRRAFVDCASSESAGFLELHCADFVETNARGEALHTAALEYVVPGALSHNTCSVALVRKHEGMIWIGVDDDDLPAAQSFTGNSEILIAPAWRLPKHIATLTPAIDWVRTRLEDEYGLSCGASFELGGRYHPSLGVTPEVVHAFAFEVIEERAAKLALHWVPLMELIAQRQELRDGHLRIVSLRVAHALGLLGG